MRNLEHEEAEWPAPGYPARESWGPVWTPGVSRDIMSSSEATDISELWINISLPQEIPGPKKSFETKKEIKKAVKSWRNDGVLKDVSITVSAGWLWNSLWLALPVFLPSPSHLTIFAVYVLFSVRVYTIYILFCYCNSPSCFACVLYLHGFNAHRSTPGLPQLIPFRVLYFDLFFGWLDFIVK